MIGRCHMRALRLIALAGSISTAQVAVGESASESNPYLELNPAFTVNVGEPSSRVSFAKVDITLRLSGVTGRERLQHHQPALRDIVVSLLSNKPLEKVETSDGREILRAQALEKVQSFLQQEEGEVLVNDLLFTSFVVQR